MAFHVLEKWEYYDSRAEDWYWKESVWSDEYPTREAAEDAADNYLAGMERLYADDPYQAAISETRGHECEVLDAEEYAQWATQDALYDD